MTLDGISQLPARQRAALLAIAVDGRAHAEVAEELGLTDGAVRQLVYRARHTLRTGATAITPAPLLHFMATSGGDATVARVAEVAAGAGGAGAASMSLKAGAAAVLATGAIATGGPKVADVVTPDSGRAATEQTASTPSSVVFLERPGQGPDGRSGARLGHGRDDDELVLLREDVRGQGEEEEGEAQEELVE